MPHIGHHGNPATHQGQRDKHRISDPKREARLVHSRSIRPNQSGTPPPPYATPTVPRDYPQATHLLHHRCLQGFLVGRRNAPATTAAGSTDAAALAQRTGLTDPRGPIRGFTRLRRSPLKCVYRAACDPSAARRHRAAPHRPAAAGPGRRPGPASAATTSTPAPDTREKLIRRFHLTWQDALEVEAAVREGRTTRPDLQPAARGFAEHTLTPPTFRGRPLTSYPLAARWAWLVFAIAALSIAARRRRRRAAAAALTANTPNPDHPYDRADPSP